jgi:peptide/nickel transport system permease protein
MSSLTVGAVAVLLFVVIMAVGAPVIAPHSPNVQHLPDRLKPPVWQAGSSPEYLLGTDSLGRDILSRLIYGARVSLAVGVVVVIVSGSFGVVVGLLAGYYRGWVEAVTMAVAEVQLAFPSILLALAISAVLGGGLLNIFLVLSIARWPPYARIVFGQTVAIREREFVTAARVAGAGNWRIMMRHILPNAFSPVIVLATFSVASAIIAEATITFLGLGVEARTPTWGGMLSDGRQYINLAWWPSTLPGIAIMLTVLSINIIGDWVRDVLDPTLRNP